MKPDKVTIEFIMARVEVLKDRWAARNDRMDDYERAYLLDLWKDEKQPDEKRVTPPTLHEVVERFRALFLSNPPVISVPPSDVKGVAASQADLLEKYLIGVWARCQVPLILGGAEWGGTCLGEGVLRCVHDDGVPEGELPLLIQFVDPRRVFATPGPRLLNDLEQAYIFKRRRRDIDAELQAEERKLWKKQLMRPEGMDGVKLEDWLDTFVEFVEYWRIDVEDVEEEVKPEKQRPVGVLRGWLNKAREMVTKMATRGAAGDTTEEGVAGGGEKKKEKPQTRTVRRRFVTRAVVADGQLIMEAARVPGYTRLPFVRYPGVMTGLDDENGALSVLFSLVGGTRQNGATGIAGAEAELLAYSLRLAEMYSNAAMWTDDQGTTKVDFSPGAVNRVGNGRTINWLVPPGVPPSVDGRLSLVQSYVENASLPAAMKGQSGSDLSGLALSALTNPVLMMIAGRQLVREQAYQLLNELILSLTEQYAPDEGWYVYGVDKTGAAFETRLEPSVINGYYRNRVELSASLPKDTAGEILMLSQLQQKGQISMETFLDQIQRIKRLSSQSTQDEMARIVRDKMLFGGGLAEQLGQLVLADYDPELAKILGVEPGKDQQPPAPPGPGGPGALPMMPGGAGGPPMMGGPMGPAPAGPGPGAGPMQGLPPGVIPPHAVPQAVGGGGAGGLEQLGNMLRMQPGANVPGRDELAGSKTRGIIQRLMAGRRRR